ncbi:CCA tRNA nucleotidyltransferase [Devosia sp. ZB163]|uniref:CCA tRNA nucleotidyltransferase n=1 Tax=Devosia sp. ZB163 TaxID=3025938 RepID=UPI00236026DB|nr:CCA tRNA nucleotidyltransferase [Devosia sp. ZB163]MDC9825532.1 CCA tRNA nucleotidyltransferase [Devosia sp. ZB163]
MIKPRDIESRLKRAEWLMRPETQRILALLDGSSHRTRAVGGIVRDTLLDRPRAAADIDLATELRPEEVSERARRAGLSVYPTGIEHGTVTLKLDSVTAEVTTLREDVETDGRHAVVRFGTDWRQDALRRDFTMNALYAGMNGVLFDPLHGLDDCLSGRVRFIGKPAERIAEDRLRVYRFFRFSASHGNEQLDREGLAACTVAAGTLGRLAAERVGAEMRRMLGLDRVAKTLRAMRDAAVLDLPEVAIDHLHSYERRVRKPQLTARLAIVSAETGIEPLRAMWRLSNDEVKSAESVLAAAGLIGDFALNEAAYRYPGALTDGIDVAATLSNWSEAGKLAVVEQLQRLDVPRFPIGGNDLVGIGMSPGKALGAELQRLERAWIESGFALDRTALLEMARG